MDSENSSDQFLTMQTLNSMSGNVIPLSPSSSGVTPVHLQDLSTTNSVAGPNSSTVIGINYMYLYLNYKILLDF